MKSLQKTINKENPMRLSIQSISKISIQLKNQLENTEKSFRQELKECSVETSIDSYFNQLETYVNGVLVSEDYISDISNNTIGLIIEDIVAFLNNKLDRQSIP